MSDSATAHAPLRRPAAGKRIRHVQQLEAADCGAACVCMVLRYWGREVPLSRMREALVLSGAGVDAATLVDGAAQFGLDGRGVKCEMEQLRQLTTGAILHWSFGHWVVFERVEAKGVRIVDPAAGRRLVPFDVFAQKFTGVALLFEPSGTFVRERVRRHHVWRHVARLFADRQILLQVLTLTAQLQVLGLALPAVTGLIVDRVVPLADQSLLLVVCAASIVVVVFHLLTGLARTLLVVELRSRLDFRLATDFIRHLTALPYAFFGRRRTCDLMLRVNSNSRLREFLGSTVISGLLDATLAVVYLAVIVSVDRTVALVVLVLGGLRVAVLLVFHARLTSLTGAQLEAAGRSQGFLAEMLAGIGTLKAAGRERHSVARWTNLYAEELTQAAASARIEGITNTLLGGLDLLSPLTLLVLGSTLTLSGTLSLGTMLAVVALGVGFLIPLGGLVRGGIQLSMLKAYLERIEDVMEAELEQKPDRDRRAPPALRGAISLHHVSFRYGRDLPLVVDDLSLEIAPGQSVAIVGESGSGKTTLANLLLGLYMPSEGEIRFDGHRVQDLDLCGLRRQVGVVSQHPYLFAGSIRDNICMGDDTVPLSRVVAAARAARIHDDVMQLPMRYESLLPDRGESLSGGQRQRIALARAILHNPSILLLDEATSALDTRTEQELTNSIERMQCTRIVIAHRLSTIVRADIVVVLDRGRIVEIGRHEDLIGRGSVYRSLVHAQTQTRAAMERA